LPDAVKNTSYSKKFSGSGGTSPYTFAKTSGSLPPGLSLASDGLLSGTPTREGTYTFTITVTDKKGCTGSREYTLRVGSGGVCPTITLSPDELPNGVKNEFYSQQFTGSGGTSPYTFALTSGSLPPGLSLASDGLLSGTPTQEGTFTFTITVTDKNGCTGSRQFTLRICPGISLTPNTDRLPDGGVGKRYSQTITASVASATFQLTGDLPPGLVGTSGSYVIIISGTPTRTGTWRFTITATTADGCSDSKDYTITILDVIPTVTEWGMMVLALALAAISFVVMRRRQVDL
ncbi:MAG: IPTL-CTERM sorting domain-containing protein, partial [Candidatus Desulfacyla sp.]